MRKRWWNLITLDSQTAFLFDLTDDRLQDIAKFSHLLCCYSTNQNSLPLFCNSTVIVSKAQNSSKPPMVKPVQYLSSSLFPRFKLLAYVLVSPWKPNLVSSSSLLLLGPCYPLSLQAKMSAAQTFKYSLLFFAKLLRFSSNWLSFLRLKTKRVFYLNDSNQGTYHWIDFQTKFVWLSQCVKPCPFLDLSLLEE